MAGYEITYNGYGSTDGQWDHVTVQNYQSTPLFSEDDQTHWSTRHAISGTAIIGAATESDLQTAITNAQKYLQKQHRNLYIEINDTIIVNSGSNVYGTGGLAGTSDISGMETDSAGYPRCTFSIDKLYGTTNALISFTFEWVDINILSGEDPTTNWAVLSHHWQQKFSFDESGLQTWSIDGTLHVRSWSVTNSGNYNNLDRNPDSYRRVVMPLIPERFRIKSMSWGTDTSGEKLVYTITLQEHARRLPKPATKGSGSFTFKKSLDSQAGLLGIKMFDAELEGDASSDTTALLAALLKASTKRINWVPSHGRPRDLITSIEVRENDIFSKKRIGLRVVARGIDPNVGDAIRGDLSQGLGFGILEDFVDEGNEAIAIDPYGSSLICSFKRELFIPYAGYSNENFPIAKLLSLDGSPINNTSGTNSNVSGAEEQAYEVPDEVIQDPDPNVEDLSGEFWDEENQSHADALYKFIKVVGVERIAQKPNVTAFSTHGKYPYHLPWQTEAPTYILESEYTLARQGEPPPMLLYNMPVNAILLDEQTSIEAGEIDGNGNRTFVRHIRRKIQLLSGWGNNIEDELNEFWMLRSWNIVGIGIVTLSYTGAAGKDMRRPHDIRFDSETNIENYTIFNSPNDAVSNQYYDINFEVPVGYVDTNP